ncbi:hypothetical protein GCM10023210_25560 [Chryseobacterium ginsengisoli]|uniref:Uncharacterized protein n=1 Tax=Chryseobacterium ginsengisoli TaxID=363853 RepID=A0ABP9MGH5_9FLAO
MNIDGFRAELETRLMIEKEYIVQELTMMDEYDEKLELLGEFNDKYRGLIRRLANEHGIDLNAPYPSDNPSSSENLTYEQIILGKTMSIYDKLVDELHEEITSTK